MRQRTRNIQPKRSGFTMVELQVAIVLLAFGMMTLAALLATQERTLKRLRGDFNSGTTLYITRSVDPWQRKLDIPARITSTTITQGSAPTPPNQLQTVDVLSVEYGLNDESVVVPAETTPIP
jgi:hypothetical protein